MPQLRELEIRPAGDPGDARAVEEMGVALRVGEDGGGLAIRLAEKPVGGAGDQTAGRVALLHQLQQRPQPVRRQGEIFPDRGEAAPVGIFMGDTEQDQPGEERLGLLVPVRLGDLVGRVHDQGIGEGGGIFAEIEAVRGQPVERVVGRSGQAGNFEGVEDMDGAEALARRPGDRSAAKRSPGAFTGSCLTILALGVDHQHGALGQ